MGFGVWGLGFGSSLTQTRIRSPAAPGSGNRQRPCICARSWSSTRSAVRRSASSRNAVRFSGEGIRQRPLGLLRHVDLALLEALDQVVGREVHKLDRIGAIENRIQYRPPNPDAGDLGDDIVEALDVLNIDGCTTSMPWRRISSTSRWRCGCRLPAHWCGRVHRSARSADVACDDGVEVHLRDGPAFVGYLLARNDFRALEQAVGLRVARGSRPRRRPHRRLRGAWHERAAALHRFCPRPGQRPQKF